MQSVRNNRYAGEGGSAMDDTLLKTFKDFGLTEYEARAYVALLTKPTMSVLEVARVAGIPRTNAYESLRRLAEKGLCTARPGRTKRYSAAEPGLMRERLLEEVEERFDAEIEDLEARREGIREARRTTRERLERLARELAPLYADAPARDAPLDYIEVLRSPLQVHHRFQELFGGASKEVLLFCKPPYLARERLVEQYDQQAALVRGGLRVRAIYEILKEDEQRRQLIRDIRASTAWGEQARVIPELPLKMAVFDERMVQIALVDPVLGETSVTSLVVDHPDLARTLKIVFETLWGASQAPETLEEKGPSRAGGG